MRCSWSHCEACFEGQVPSGWKLVARQKNTGEQVVVCPQHYRELLDADVRLMLRLARGPEPSLDIPVLSDTDELPVEETKRLGPGLKK